MGTKVVIIHEMKKHFANKFGYLAYFCLVIWLNDIWLFGLKLLGRLVMFCSVIWDDYIRLFVTCRLET